MQNRRHFLKQSIAAGALAGIARADDQPKPEAWPILLFE